MAESLEHFLSFWVSEGNVRVDWLQSFLLNQCLLDLVQCIFVLDNLESFPFILEGQREGREEGGGGGGRGTVGGGGQNGRERDRRGREGEREREREREKVGGEREEWEGGRMIERDTDHDNIYDIVQFWVS